MNKKVGIIAIVVIVILASVGVFRYFTKEDNKTTLTVTEKKWIENNKNNLIDLSIPSDVDIISNNGEGIVFDFLDDLESDTGLDFNKLSYSSTDDNLSDYAVVETNKKKNGDILLFQDNYALITKNKVKYYNTSEISNLTIGVLSDDLTDVDKYLLGSSDISYKSYKDASSMINDVSAGSIDAIILPRIKYLDDILDKNLYFSYNITEFTNDYVLRLGNTNKLNKILTKYFEKWSSSKLDDKVQKMLVQTYFDAKDVNEKDQVKFRSKRYNYGFVNYAPFDVVSKDGFKGINHSFLSDFARASNIEINYKKYSSIDSLLNDFNANNLDVIFDDSASKYKMDVDVTPSVFDEKVAIISKGNFDVTINSVNSLASSEVVTLKNSKIDDFLRSSGVKTKSFDNINVLINKAKKSDLIAIDYYTYDCFVRSDLKDYKLLYDFNLDSDYGYVVRSVSANKIFSDLFDFYLSFIDNKKVINSSYSDVLDYNNNNKLLQNLLVIFVAVLLVLIGTVGGKFLKRRKGYNRKLSKMDKLRYVDNLTSLKNRNYLNDNIEKWDNSAVYPQTVIVIDLNNITYINDNFGHTEGDKVIVEGAGILISNQLPNSEMIRSNGNEFLIYTVGYDEKEIITYIRKLNKEFKKLSHNFGAAIGYSMITDEIKTFDDAVNEATSDMRNNKEDDK